MSTNRVLSVVIGAVTAALLVNAFAQSPMGPNVMAPEVPRSVPPCSAAFKANVANRQALCGESKSTDGVLGVSEQRYGVTGTGGIAGVAGIARRGAKGVLGVHTAGGVAVAGETTSIDYPAAMFTNRNTSGDHIWAGPENAPVFQVKGDGRVFVQGTQIGLKGDRGDRGDRGELGPRGERGEPGPSAPARSVAVCGQTTVCGCSSLVTVVLAVTVASTGGSCSATAESGPCTYTDSARNGPGVCCVCAPQ